MKTGCFVALLTASLLFLHSESLPVQSPLQTSYGKSGLGLGFQALVNLEKKVGKIGNGVSCTVCKIGTGLLHAYLQLETTDSEIEKILTKVCIDLKIEDVNVCNGIIKEFKNEALTVFDQAVVTPSDICGTILGPSCANAASAYGPWNVTFPKQSNLKAPMRVRPSRKEGSPISKVIQLSDTHLDRLYMEGANTKCGEPLCCRKTNGKAPKGVTPAGKFGYFDCDTPEVTLNGLLQHIKDTHKDLDYIIWTGDVPAHNVWNQSRDDQVSALKGMQTTLSKYFPDTKVYPALGNHESAPVNSFPPPFIKGESSNIWLLEALANSWGTWLPKDTRATILKGGYYTTLVRKGLRIVSLNLNYCNNMNYWLLINNVDPAGQLQWMVGVLQEAEKNHEMVHILGHIPPGTSDCLSHWSWNYYAIINRYAHVVTAQFFGHTHHDEFEIFYKDANLMYPSSIAYVGPSVTPYTNLNPGYRVYEVDGDYANSTAVVLDHLTYIIDLEKANKLGTAVWEFEYRATEAYKMKSLLPSDWNDFVNRMSKDDALFKTFYRHVWKGRPPACNKACMKYFLCRLRSGRSFSEKDFCGHQTGFDLKFHRMFSFGLRKC